jgi:hypothetical protein
MAMGRWLLLLAMLCVTATGAAQAADNNDKGANLQTYRQRAAVAGVCPQLGGKILHGAQGPQCQLPKVVKGGAAQTREVVGKPSPLSSRR